jgi:hypothetical protein
MLENRPHRDALAPLPRFRSAALPFPRRRQGGAFAVMTVGLIFVIIAFCGFAIELGMVYNRKAELQTVADTLALAAADKLDGTGAGIDNAAAAAASAAVNLLYSYNAGTIDWVPEALSFSSSPDGPDWLEAGAANTDVKAANLFYARVDTSRLDAKHGRVTTIFMRILSEANAQVIVGSTAVAGRSTINVMPLGLCVMSPLEADTRSGELVQYGFRRGVSYSLTELNPDTAVYGNTGVNFLINPVAPPGTTGTSVVANTDVIQPFVCTGSMAMPRVTGGNLTVEQGFPLASVYAQLNSRFGSYTDPCKSDTAPPDANVKEYKNLASDFKWMATPPSGLAAESSTLESKLHTILDLQVANIDASKAAGTYGPLWIYAKAAKYSTGPEPAAGYPTFSANNADWASLYPPAKPKISPTSSYPSPTPYGAASGASFLAPSGGLKGVRERRVLNVPLLDCPVSAGSPASANVRAIAKFFMTSQATSQKIYAEFGGLVQPSTLGGQVELYR